MLPQTEVSRLPQFRGNEKDTLSVEQWAVMVDRHIDVLNWTPRQVAGAACEALRDDAAEWQQNLATSPHDDKRAAVKDWTLLRPRLVKRFDALSRDKVKRVEALATLKQHAHETVDRYADRVEKVINLLTKNALEKARGNLERKQGYLDTRELIESSIFHNGLRQDVKQWVNARYAEANDDHETLLELARSGENAEQRSRGAKVHAVSTSEPTAQVAATTRKQPAGNRQKMKRTRNIPMNERNAIKCYKCKQWGRHMMRECKLTREECESLTPGPDERPVGDVHDTQYPNA